MVSSENAHGRKIIKDDCVSILFCCRADGFDKRLHLQLSGRFVVITVSNFFFLVIASHKPKGLAAASQSRMKCHFTGSGYMFGTVEQRPSKR